LQVECLNIVTFEEGVQNIEVQKLQNGAEMGILTPP